MSEISKDIAFIISVVVVVLVALYHLIYDRPVIKR